MLVIALTGTFTGMVLALQSFPTLRRVGSEALLGPLVALSLTRELGPVLTALMVTGRAGSAIARRHVIILGHHVEKHLSSFCMACQERRNKKKPRFGRGLKALL